MEFFGRLAQQLRQLWQGMSRPQQFALAAVAILSAALIVGIAYWSTQPEYRVLFSGLSPEDAANVTSRLKDLNVPYRLTANSTTVQVPTDRVAQIRIDLAAEGLPAKVGPGFELFNESQLGATPFTQQVNYQRALQNELARTIMQIEPIAYARVIIARSEPSPFVREQKPTTASVVVRLKPAATLSRSAAAGIVALVARSVEGLKPDNVTVMDDHGRVLSEPQTPETGAVASQLDYRRALESYLASKAESMLAQLLGPGRAIVRVAADINFQRLKERRETYNPEARAITSEKISSSQSTSTPTTPRGVPGTTANVPPGGAATAGGQSTSSKEESNQTDYAVSRTIQEIEDKLGSVDRLTVAALVDLNPGNGKSGLTLKDAQDIIEQAIGFKEKRDVIKVSNVKLTSTLPSQEAIESEVQRVQYWEQIAHIVRAASLGVAALAILLLGWIMLRRAFPKPTPSPSPPAPPPPSPEAVERQRAREHRMAAMRRDPQAIAAALARYLAREEGV